MHRGELLQKAVAESGLTITFITKKVGYSRSSFYNHVADKDLSLEILIEYGSILKYDFLHEHPEIVGNIATESSAQYSNNQLPKTLDQAIEQRNMWREKYFELLEKYQKLLELQLNKN